MRPLPAVLSALALGFLSSASVRAEVFIRVPFVTIRVGRPVPPPPPPFVVPPQGVPAPVPVLPVPQQAPPAVPLPVPQVQPVPALPGPPAVGRVPTLAEFAATFQPLPGRYEVILLHPVTRCPVRVCFTLPPGCPRKVHVHRREIEWVYPRGRVEVRFMHNGSVRVRQ